MTRNQAAYAMYNKDRYMQHLTEAELAERLDDCANIVVGLKEGKVAMSSPIEGKSDDYPGFGFAWQKFVDVYEEYRLRGKTERVEITLPAIGRRLIDAPVVGFSDKTPSIDWETESKTGLGQRIVDVVESIQRKYPQAVVLVKYGQKQHMERLAKDGLVRIGTAQDFEKDSNHARQDYETNFEMHHANRGKTVVRCNDYWLWCCTLANEGAIWVARCVHDFSADAAVVIVDGKDFLYEMQDMMHQINIYAHFQGARGMVYSDPLIRSSPGRTRFN